MPPLVLDAATQKLQELAASADWLTLSVQSAHETALRVSASCPPPQRTLVGIEAANYLQTIIPLTQADMIKQHSNYGAVRWLWYLRRAPDSLFEGSYGTTLGYDRLLAEILSSQFTALDIGEAVERVAFRVNDSTFRYLARYIGRVKLLSHLHVLYRRVGKGATLDASRPILMANTSDAIDRAIHIYDLRHDRSHEFIGAGLGMVTIAPDFQQLVDERSASEPIAFLSISCTRSFQAPVTYPDGAGGLSIATVNVRHVIKKLSLSRVLNPIGVEGGIPDYIPRIAALIQLLMFVPAICVHVPWALSSITQQGYVFLGEERLRDIVDHHIREVVGQLAPLTPGFAWPVDFIQWRDSLLAVTASVWPLSSGNVVRRFRDNLLIDITGASQALLHRIELTRSPTIGNMRAEKFELQCQDIIEATPWVPSPEVKSLRGRPLRQSGKIITDIDAIGVRERTLLIVSCKSIIYDRDYDQGEFRVIRNSQATIDDAAESWERVVAELRRHDGREL